MESLNINSQIIRQEQQPIKAAPSKEVRVALGRLAARPEVDGGTWMNRALCQEADPEIFDPDTKKVEKAKEYCGACSVTEECLAYALRNNETSLIYGGLTLMEMRKLRRRRRNQ